MVGRQAIVILMVLKLLLISCEDSEDPAPNTYSYSFDPASGTYEYGLVVIVTQNSGMGGAEVKVNSQTFEIDKAVAGMDDILVADNQFRIPIHETATITVT